MNKLSFFKLPENNHTVRFFLSMLWIGLISLFLLQPTFAGNTGDLLPAEKAFIPSITVTDQEVIVQFNIADGYYLYRDKISVETSPKEIISQPTFSHGKEKHDEFFGKQEVYYHTAEVRWLLNNPSATPFKLTLHYQGCADAGICYPPVDNTFEINGTGQYDLPTNNLTNRFLSNNQPSSDNIPNDNVPKTQDQGRFNLSWNTLGANLLAFFIAGLGLSLTACMYPLLPIVSSIIIGDQKGGKKRAFLLATIYVQGLAVTYTLVGVIAGLTGSLLTVWLQQAWVVLLAALIMVVLALAMFDVYTLQLPNKLQSFFQNQSSKLSGGKVISVFFMGIFSALIVGPCVAPPLAVALGYIGQTGDAVLGGLALYILALGTGVPLILVATFGGHILPKAGSWMNGIKYTFGLILLAVATYLATPYLPYSIVVTIYSLLLIVPGIILLVNTRKLIGQLKIFAMILGISLMGLGVYFSGSSITRHQSFIHQFLTLTPKTNQHFGQSFTDPSAMNAAIEQAFHQDDKRPVIIDFYADWCISCKEMAAYTFSQDTVQAALDENRFFQLDVTDNTPAQQAMLKDYGLFGPPGLFVVHSNGQRSEPLLGFVPPEPFLTWYHQQSQ